jgi:hypothetical protein
VLSLLSPPPGDAEALLVVENGKEGDSNIKLPVCAFVGAVLFKKLEAQPLTLELEGNELAETGNISAHFIF